MKRIQSSHTSASYLKYSTGSTLCQVYNRASKISTSYVERQNLTMRMSMRRFTRLTNAFSKKVENHILALALYFMYYNFARPHKSLANPYPRTPAMAAGISDHVWTVEETVKLVS